MKQQLKKVCLLFGALPAMHACYTYVPVDASIAPPLGERVAFSINDRGRAALAERLGPSVSRVEGTLTRQDSSDYVMSVWQIGQYGEASSKWSGESVRINRDFVTQMQEKRLSRGKTYLAIGAAVAGLALIAKSQGLVGSASEDNNNPPPPPGQSSIGLRTITLKAIGIKF